jgi:uncharacterized protein YkwD
MSSMSYKSQSARDAFKWGGQRYADYIERGELEYAAKFPDRAEYFLTRTIGEALRGNDGI